MPDISPEELSKRPALGQAERMPAGEGSPLRIAILWRTIQDGDNAAFRALSEFPGVELFCCFPRPTSDAPLDDALYGWMSNTFTYQGVEPSRGRLAAYLSSGVVDRARLVADLTEFRPDAFLVNSWHVAAYRHVLGRFDHCFRVMRIDNQWKNSLRQQLAARFMAKHMMHRYYEAVFVPGERTALFARSMGFAERAIWHGSFTCNHGRYAAVYRQAQSGARTYGRAFLFVGRLIPYKDIDTLVAGYARYRAMTDDPWPLIICGSGPEEPKLAGQPGIELHGFVQPDDLPALFGRSSCMVLTSVRENWGHVLHEAAAAGLAIICTTRPGAAVHLVQDHLNGYLFGAGDVEGLAAALLRYSRLSDAERQSMADHSFALSLQFTPALWARRLYSHLLTGLGRA